MTHPGRTLFPYVVCFLGLAAVAWAVSFGTLPPADFTFANGDDVQTVDPSKATGQPEHRVLVALFEGLLRNLPGTETASEDGVLPMHPQPAVAKQLPEISADGRVYTFRLRPTARWSNGRVVTADDFVWSWRRCLHPETASKYAYQLHYLVNAEKYNTSRVDLGDRVEVELDDRPDRLQPFPRGRMRRGVLRQILKPPPPTAGGDSRAAQETLKKLQASWQNQWVYVVEVKPLRNGDVDWQAPGKLQAFSPEPAAPPAADAGRRLGITPQKCLHVLIDFDSQVGVRASDERTLVVTLKHRTPYFSELVCFYTLYPVNRECVEKYGTPNWTKPRNIVSNGPYRLELRRIRDRLRMVRNPHYWNRQAVRLQSIDVLAVKSQTTALSMYLKGEIDWATDVPKLMIPDLRERSDFITAPLLSTYFYRINVTRPPLDNVLVRRALNLAIDKRQICQRIAKAGEQPARSLVPPGMAGYQAAVGEDYDLEKARQLLAEAGYPGGGGLPKIEILYNTQESHRAIAEVIGQMWKNHLGIDVELKNVEWGSYLDKQRILDYSVARAGWVGDYPDPNTFLDMFVTDGGQNQTGWSNPRYDELIRQAAAESDASRRLRMLREAESILMSELPILPIYFYVSINMVQPQVSGFAPNSLDEHPLHTLSVKR